MGILDELSSATGAKQSNLEVAKRCLETPALLHTVSEGLRTGEPSVRIDCAQILHEVATRRPEIVANFAGDFLDASRDGLRKGGSKKISKFGFAGLVLVVQVQPNNIFAARDFLFETAKRGDAIALQAAAVLAALCGANANYRGKLLGNTLRLLNTAPDKDLPKWIKTLAPAAAGSADAVKRLTEAIAPKQDLLPPPARKSIDRLMLKLERSTVKKK